jgi:hypothetical protein
MFFLVGPCRLGRFGFAILRDWRKWHQVDSYQAADWKSHDWGCFRFYRYAE